MKQHVSAARSHTYIGAATFAVALCLACFIVERNSPYVQRDCIFWLMTYYVSSWEFKLY